MAQWQAEGSAALVTGAASGIGLACARALVAAGAKVALVDVSAAAGKAATAELRKKFGEDRAVFVSGDVRSDADMEAAFDAAEASLGPLNAVVHCAGVFDDANWQRAIDINLSGTVRVCLLARKRMAAAGLSGAVLCIASIAGLEAVPPTPVYSASKHGVVGLVRSLGAMDQAGPRLMALCPAATDTPMVQQLFGTGDDPQELYLELAWQKMVADVASSTEPMKPSTVAASAMRALREGGPGSVWVSESGLTYRAQARPLREQMEPGSETREDA